MQRNLVNQPELAAYVEERGYRTERVFNTIEFAQQGVDLRVVGLALLGPRGTKGFVPLENGFGDMGAAALWCDFVDYGTQHAQQRRTARAISCRREV